MQVPGQGKNTVLAQANRVLSLIETAFLIIAGVVTGAVMLIVSADVLMRYAMNNPFAWSYDLIGIYLLPVAFFFALPATWRRNAHVAVDIAYLKFGEKLKRLARLIAALVTAPLLGWIVALSLHDALARYRGGDVIPGVVLWPTWIPSALVAAGTGVLVMRLALDALALAAALATDATVVDGESPSRGETGSEAPL